ncbi:MAG: MFS transporter, partial [Pseudomonadota bacterium]|nr:MFS transporter [Pseudomonadota bacterium]
AGSLGVLALTCIAAGLAGTTFPLIAGACLLAGSIAGSSLDGVGGIPFLRAVKTRERAEMSGVYRTYNDMSDLIPSLIFSLLLLFLPLGAVFITLGLGLLIITALSWIYLPRSL